MNNTRKQSRASSSIAKLEYLAYNIEALRVLRLQNPEKYSESLFWEEQRFREKAAKIRDSLFGLPLLLNPETYNLSYLEKIWFEIVLKDKKYINELFPNNISETKVFLLDLTEPSEPTLIDTRKLEAGGLFIKVTKLHRELRPPFEYFLSIFRVADDSDIYDEETGTWVFGPTESGANQLESFNASSIEIPFPSSILEFHSFLKSEARAKQISKKIGRLQGSLVASFFIAFWVAIIVGLAYVLKLFL